MSEELKACPFCGKAPRVTLTSDGIVTGIQCDNRACSGNFSILEILNDHDIMVRTWNTRPVEDRLRAKLAAETKRADDGAWMTIGLEVAKHAYTQSQLERVLAEIVAICCAGTTTDQGRAVTIPLETVDKWAEMLGEFKPKE